jgi:hypothetical protein
VALDFASAAPPSSLEGRLLRVLATHPDPPRPVPVGTLLLLMARTYWWALLWLVLVVWGLGTTMGRAWQGQRLTEFDLLMVVISGLLLALVLPWPILTARRIYRVLHTSRRAPATVLRILAQNTPATATAPDAPVDHVVALVAFPGPSGEEAQDVIAVGAALAPAVVPGARLEVLADPDRPVAWGALRVLAAVPFGAPPRPEAPPPVTGPPALPAVAAGLAGQRDPLGLFAAQVLVAQPTPPRRVALAVVRRRVFTLSASLTFLVLGGLCGLGGGYLVIRDDPPAAGDDSLVTVLLILLALGAAALPAVLAWRVRWALRHGGLTDAEVLSTAFSADPREFQGQRARRTTGWLDPTYLDALENGRTVGRWRVTGPHGSFEDLFMVDRAWGPQLGRGRHLLVLVDPRRPRVLLEVGPVPVAGDRLTGPTQRAPARRGWLWAITLVGLALLAIAAWDLTQAVDARADTARYTAAPRCLAQPALECRTAAPVTIVAVRDALHRSTVTRWVTVQELTGPPREIRDWSLDLACCIGDVPTPGPPDLALMLQPGMQVEGEYWAGTLVLLRGADGRVMITEDYPPYRVHDRQGWVVMWGMLGGLILLLGGGLWWEGRRTLAAVPPAPQ